MKTKVFGKLGFFLALWGIPATACASAQQKSQPSSAAAEGTPAKIKCDNEAYVSITADPERALPLRLVATAACDAPVTVLSDSQAYTVKVRTAAGTIGYVTRYEVVMVSSMKDAVALSSLATRSDSSGPPTQGQKETPAAAPQPATDDKTAPKPRVFISDTESWTESGGFTNSSGVVPGYNPEMADIYQDFTSDCPVVVVVQEKSNADYAILFDKGTNKKGFTGLGGLVKVNRVTVLSRSGQTLVSQSSRSADATVGIACNAIVQRASAHSAPQKAVP